MPRCTVGPRAHRAGGTLNDQGKRLVKGALAVLRRQICGTQQHMTDAVVSCGAALTPPPPPPKHWDVACGTAPPPHAMRRRTNVCTAETGEARRPAGARPPVPCDRTDQAPPPPPPPGRR